MEETRTYDENMFVSQQTATNGENKYSMPETISATGIKVPCQMFSRIVGYLTPLDGWNAGKRQEFADRVTFNPNDLPDGAPPRTAPGEVK